MSRKQDLSVEKVKKLENLKLPSDQWECIKAEVEFERKGILGEWAVVVYDGRNNTFYVKTNKAIVYQNDTPTLEEAIDLMRQANKIIGSPIKDGTPQ